MPNIKSLPNLSVGPLRTSEATIVLKQNFYSCILEKALYVGFCNFVVIVRLFCSKKRPGPFGPGQNIAFQIWEERTLILDEAYFAAAVAFLAALVASAVAFLTAAVASSDMSLPAAIISSTVSIWTFFAISANAAMFSAATSA